MVGNEFVFFENRYSISGGVWNGKKEGLGQKTH